MERAHPSPLFLAGLIAAAAVLLGVGATLRPRTEQPTTAVPSNELATLPELSQRRSLRDLADYINERASSSAPSVVYLTDYATSALALGPDSVLTAVAQPKDASTPGIEPVRFLRIRAPRVDSTRPALPRHLADSVRIRWALLVARSPDGQVLSLPGMVGGRIGAQCGDLEMTELIFDSSVPPAFRGAGVFDLDGNVVALVVPCGGRMMLVPLADVARSFEQQGSTPYRLWVELGFRLGPPPGLRVTEVRGRSPSARAGLRVGDLIVAADSAPARSLEDLSALLSDHPGRLVLRRTRSGVILRNSR
jgi:PDZ domain-containing protein